MIRSPLLRLFLLLPVLLAACASGPDPADVAADRARWRGVRDATADGVLSPAESVVLAELLVAWDEQVTALEAAANTKQKPEAVLAELLRVYGVAMVDTFFAPELQRRAPELFRLVDKDGNGSLSAEELTSIDPTSPVFALVVASTVHRLIKRK